MSILDGFFSLARDINKVKETEEQAREGVVSDLVPELKLSMSDEELIALKKSWIKRWEPYSEQIRKRQDENEAYWLGEHFSPGSDIRPLKDNLIFEALETFLPIATRPTADPVVDSDDSEEGRALADKVRKMLVHLSDKLRYNLKVKQVVRFWALYKLGVIKVGWSTTTNDITCKAVRPQNLILEPEATIEEGQYSGYYIGEYIKDIAFDLALRFPDKKSFIKEKVKDNMGTQVRYIQWWTKEYLFWTLDDEVLDKVRNPHWNYETEEPTMNEFGVEEKQKVEGNNHFSEPQMPYVFLSIFNLGKQPHDETSLIEQNIPLQDLTNKRLSQIDKNADSANGGLIVSGDAFTEKQAAVAAKALRKGGTIYVPQGDVDKMVRRDTGAPMPPFVYQSLLDYRNELRNIFGTRGSTPQGTMGEQTVRGKLITKGQDQDRIGGGISTFLEQFSDQVFNWFVQLMYVYYDEPHSASVLGQERAREYITLKNSDFVADLMVSVKDGSMLPQDPVSKRNEAIDLWGAKGIDPITFFERLDFPNPRESAKNLFLWLSDPVQLFPDLFAQQQQQQQQQLLQQQLQQVQQAQAEQGQQREKQRGDLAKVAISNLTRGSPK